MASKTEICNFAISHLGTAKEISDLETENSQEAKVCRRFYDVALESTLRDFDWSFARKVKTLSLVEEEPNDEWSFSYRHPVDCIRILKIQSGTRNDTRQSRVSFFEGRDDVGRLVYTDQEDAIINYISKTENPQLYPPDFMLCLSFRLAYLIAPRITGGNAFTGIAKDMYTAYQMHLSQARQNALTEEQREEVVESEFVRGRE